MPLLIPIPPLFLYALPPCMVSESPSPTPLLLPLLIPQLVLQRIVSGLALLPVLVGVRLPARSSSLCGCRRGGCRWVLAVGSVELGGAENIEGGFFGFGHCLGLWVGAGSC